MTTPQRAQRIARYFFPFWQFETPSNIYIYVYIYVYIYINHSPTWTAWAMKTFLCECETSWGLRHPQNLPKKNPDLSTVLCPRNVETIFPAAAMDTALAVIKDICKSASGVKMFIPIDGEKNIVNKNRVGGKVFVTRFWCKCSWWLEVLREFGPEILATRNSVQPIFLKNNLKLCVYIHH